MLPVERLFLINEPDPLILRLMWALITEWKKPKDDWILRNRQVFLAYEQKDLVYARSTNVDMIATQIPPTGMAMIRNIHPYDMLPGVGCGRLHHVCIWTKEPKLPDDQTIVRFVTNVWGTRAKAVFFANTKENMTINEFHHGHLIGHK